jgi:hypothetical protein
MEERVNFDEPIPKVFSDTWKKNSRMYQHMRAEALKISPGLPEHLIDMAVVAYFENRQEYRRRSKTEFPIPEKGCPGMFSVSDTDEIPSWPQQAGVEQAV